MLDKPICQILSLTLTHSFTHACTRARTPQHTRAHTHTHTTTQHAHLFATCPSVFLTPHGVHPPGQWMLNNPTNYNTVYLVQMSNLQRDRQTSGTIVGPGSLIDLVKKRKAVYTYTPHPHTPHPHKKQSLQLLYTQSHLPSEPALGHLCTTEMLSQCRQIFWSRTRYCRRLCHVS